MNEFWTADLHLGHANIIKYCNRPFKNIDHMNDRLISEINMRCKEGDVLYHLGDFCFRGNERGAKCSLTRAEEYQNRINPKIVHFIGNHDRNNFVKGSIIGCFMIVGPYQVWAQHIPPWEARYKCAYLPGGVTAYLCGHVHEKWKVAEHGFYGKPVINVGCDVWGYRPIKKSELIETIRRAIE